MATFDPQILRRIAGWETDGVPVTSLYLDLDGRRRPRRAEYVRRAEDLTRQASEAAERGDRDAARSVSHDRDRIGSYVRDGLERRGSVRGLATFSASAAGLWEAVPLPLPVRDRVYLGPRPHLLPLESLVEMAETFCTAIVDREKARVLLGSLGEIEEVTSILDDVPGRHDQGGWAQKRMQRHIEDHVQRHLKHVAEALLRLKERRGFDHLVIAGPDEAVADLERELHDYLRRCLVARTSLPISAAADQVLERTMELERDLETERERRAVERLTAEADGGSGRAAAGMEATLGALQEGRVETLVVLADLEATGVRCRSCGHLASGGDRCAMCGGELADVPDLAEVAVEEALRTRCRVLSVGASADLEAIGGIGGLLRF